MTRYLLLFVSVAGLLLGGCATRSTVKQELEPLSDKLSTLQKKIDALEGRLKKIREAAAREEAAIPTAGPGKAAASAGENGEDKKGLLGKITGTISSVLGGGDEEKPAADPAARAEAAAARAEAAAKRAEAAADRAEKGAR